LIQNAIPKSWFEISTVLIAGPHFFPIHHSGFGLPKNLGSLVEIVLIKGFWENDVKGFWENGFPKIL
jgi:hypothetical protein